MEQYEQQMRSNLQSLLEGNGAVYEMNEDDISEAILKHEQQTGYSDTEALNYAKFECLGLSEGLSDEKEYAEEPFEELGNSMQDITSDGKIKKRVIREGYGDFPKAGCQATVDYNAYVEYNDNPFDSTYLRKRPLYFYVDCGETLPAIDFAVQSMKVNEKAQFLVHYDYAYGKMGCLGRIPPESTILFEIELKNVVKYEGLSSYKKLSEEDQKQFSEVYKYAQALCLKAKELFNRNPKAAVKEYNIAASKLEYCMLGNYEEQEKQQALLLRIYTNLAVCYGKLELPRKTCIFSNKVFALTRGTRLRVPCKVYFNNARALRQLQDYDLAYRRLKRAQALEPKNVQISEEFLVLEKEMKESKERENAMAKAMIAGEAKKVGITEDFKDAVRVWCEEVMKKGVRRQAIREVLSDIEEKYAKAEAEKMALKFVKCGEGRNAKYLISKE